MAAIPIERSFVMIKPDGVKRGLVGECFARIERVGLKIVAMKMILPTKEQIDKHYPAPDAWLERAGKRTIDNFAKDGIDVKKEFGTDVPIEIGKQVKKWLIRTLTSGPVVVAVVEGYRACENVRKITGPTDPVAAPPGSIRGAFSLDSAALGNLLHRPIFNIIHASENAAEAAQEIIIYFEEKDFQKYKRIDEDLFYSNWD